ncbi:zinc finger BED domain-containing protein DAYSLEEPER-like [Humulus lupulus]|uniref:zinc finger BED domain-containing protein DAYSLEEPER-like n=1 Tax=Humulus lupulus TaxID=3486 RepID=UPI002B40C2EB|nr:zinc finger BED domain-containing protein DAYSLEEPER-like [Humulus lupulus]
MTVAIVLDPRYKFMLIEYFFPKLYGNDLYEIEIEKARKLCYDLLDEYKSKCPDLSERSHQLDNASASFSTQDDLSNYDTYVIVASGAENAKSELDAYLDEKVLPRTDEFFDICNYCKVTRFKYPMLSKIARDIFAAPISTVASESAFSTGGRHVGSPRSRLHPTTLEALVCTQS